MTSRPQMAKHHRKRTAPSRYSREFLLEVGLVAMNLIACHSDDARSAGEEPAFVRAAANSRFLVAFAPRNDKKIKIRSPQTNMAAQVQTGRRRDAAGLRPAGGRMRPPQHNELLPPRNHRHWNGA